MNNLEIILDEFSRLKGQHVLCGNGVYRLIAIGDDSEDYYYVLFDGRKSTWHSCVGRITQLKDKIESEDYNEYIRMTRLNSYDSSELWGSKDTEEISKINQKMKLEVETLDENHKFLTEVCWELN